MVSYIPAEESVGEVRLRPQEPEEDAVGDLQRVWAVGMDLGVQVFQGAYAARARGSLCVGGGEDVGGWELASGSLDVSPGLAASSPPRPPHPLSFCSSLICPRTLSSSPETAGSPAQDPLCLSRWYRLLP